MMGSLTYRELLVRLWKKRGRLVKRCLEIRFDIFWFITVWLHQRNLVMDPWINKLNKFNGIHSGSVGLLLGNGPSVKVADLDEFAKRDDLIVLACNRIHLAYAKTILRPQYVFSSDEQVIRDFGDEILDSNETVFFVSKSPPSGRENLVWIFLKKKLNFIFSEKPELGLQSNGGTLVSAIQIGFMMGIREFYMYGIDHNFVFDRGPDTSLGDAVGDDNHFIKDYRSGKAWQAPDYELVEDALIRCDKFLRAKGGFLKNATRGGQLNVLERADIDLVLGQMGGVDGR